MKKDSGNFTLKVYLMRVMVIHSGTNQKALNGTHHVFFFNMPFHSLIHTIFQSGSTLWSQNLHFDFGVPYCCWKSCNTIPPMYRHKND